MAHSADGSRLFSCGTSKEGESYLVEWNESEGAVKRTYQGFCKRSLGVVQFDTTKNRFLAAGDDGLPLLRTFENRPFDSSRTLTDNVTKNVASPLSAGAVAISSGLVDRASPAVTMTGMNGGARNLVDVKPRITEELTDRSKSWKPTEINEPAHCRSLRLIENMRTSKSPEDSAVAITIMIRHHETEYLPSLEASYLNLPDTTFRIFEGSFQ